MNFKRFNSVAVLLLILFLSACGMQGEMVDDDLDAQNIDANNNEAFAPPLVTGAGSGSQFRPQKPQKPHKPHPNRPDPEVISTSSTTSVFLPDDYAPPGDSFTESPVAESPVAESPVAESPVVESPVAESPVAESPVVESPVVESPVVESPVVESPIVESPVVESPVVEIPEVEQPNVEDPVSDELPEGSLDPISATYTPQKEGLLLSTGNKIKAPGEGGGSAFRVTCSFTHDNYDDAIVSPNQKDAAHHHSYFGNDVVNNTAHNDPARLTDPNHIKNIGRPSCRGGTANRSAYWMPTLYDASGKPQGPDWIMMYYKPGSLDHKTIQPFPEGLTIIAGNAGAIEEQEQYLRWTCFTPGVEKYTYTWPYPVVIPAGDAACQTGEQLKTHLHFPQCWDGVNLKDVDHDDDPNNDDSDDPDNPHSHMAYMINPPGVGYSCPTSHPVPLPRISFEFRYDIESGTTDGWHLSSDRMHGANKPGGMTFHGDWMNGWDTEIMNLWVKHCINEDRSCSNDLGNGTWLVEDKTLSEGIFTKYVGRPMIHDMDHMKVVSQNTHHSTHDPDHEVSTTNPNVESPSNQGSDTTINPAGVIHNSASSQGLGTNLDGMTDWGQTVPFVDVMRLARPFDQQSWADIDAVVYDSKGWPEKLNGDLAYTVMHGLDLANKYYDGIYTVMYEGEGKLEYAGSATLVKAEGGKDLVSYVSGNSFHLKIVESDVKNPIRDVKVILPGGVCEKDLLTRVVEKSQCKDSKFISFAEHHEKFLFNPDFKKYVSKFSSIRFMDWMHTNNSPVDSWTDNKTLANASWSPVGNKVGAPIEVMVELANQTNVDPWFTMPHMADDDYVRKFAEYVKANLSSELKPYLEYSNEVWNGSFEQYNYALERGRKLGLDNSEHWYAASKFYARRSVEMFKIWEDVFGSSDKFTRVLASQFVSDFRTNMILEFESAYKHADALAVAPYFSGRNVAADKIKSVTDVFEYIDTQKSAWIESLNKQAELAKRYSLDLIAYEGGQHQVQSDDERLTDLFIQANRDPRMGEQYTWHLDQWKKTGGKHFVIFTSPARYSKWGSWGIKEYITQPRSEAPKYDAVLDWMEDNPKWW